MLEADDVLAELPGPLLDALATSRTVRAEVTKFDPLLFALVYLRHHVTAEVDGSQTFSRFHVEVSTAALEWATPATEAASTRDAWIAPRGVGKSTWLFLILPMWAAAHGHKRFAAAFAHSGPQAQQHLQTFRNELDNNDLLSRDFPDLCTPLTSRGRTVSDTSAQVTMANGFTFAARGIEGGVLGMKVGERRPDLIILDDVEPDEASYSLYQMRKRRGTLIDAILPLNIFAHVVLAGTTTIAGGIVHQLVKHALGEDVEQPEEWIEAERFTVHYFNAIETNAEGERVSLWPAKWPIEYLLSIEHTRSYAKNMANKPVATDGAYWDDEDLADAGQLAVTRKLLSLDPAVTAKDTSDFTGAAVLGLVPPEYSTPDSKGRRQLVAPRRAVVERTWQLRLVIGEPLRRWVLAQLEADPTIGAVLVETNQGGDLWQAVLHDLPVRLLVVHQSEPKEVRATRLLGHCQTRRVLFRGAQPAFRTEALAYPNTAHDDVIDAVGSGSAALLDRKPAARVAGTTLAYAG